MSIENEVKHIQMVNQVKALYEQTPECSVVDSDTILKDIMDEVSFEETGLSMDIFNVYLKSKDKESLENLFYTLTGEKFEVYLDRCLAETTRRTSEDEAEHTHYITK